METMSINNQDDKVGGITPEESQLSVDYSTLEVMIVTSQFDWKHVDITAKLFPVVGNGFENFEWKLFHFDRTMSSESAVDAIKVDGWEPAKFECLLSFGEKYPEEQRKYPIAALGSVAVVGPRVPYLDGSDAESGAMRGAERGISLRWWKDDWEDIFRFLAVRKLSSAPQA
jgi:hypothetical protein